MFIIPLQFSDNIFRTCWTEEWAKKIRGKLNGNFDYNNIYMG